MSDIKKNSLFTELKQLIESSKQKVALTVNSEITLLYWNIGCCINSDILNNNKAEYGKQIISLLSVELSKEYGRGWSERQLFYCLKFADMFPDKQILHTVCAKLSWSHIRLTLSMESSLKRDFYIQLCTHENWSVRVFKERIKSLLYERTAISQKSELTIQNDLQKLETSKKMNADLVFRDPYFLDFLGLKNTYSEKDLEDSILAELQNFIIELGSDFAFMARQKRITIDDRDYYIDLLFFHRRLKCLVAIELKIGEFESSHKGQMELYLSYLEKHEKVEGENSPIGLILCTGKTRQK